MRVNTCFQNTLGINILSQDQVEEIHLATLEVLDRVGIKVHEKEALELLRQKGAKVDDNWVRIPAWMVKEALLTAPCRVSLANRNGDRTIFLEKGRSYYGSGSATQFVIDVYDGHRRSAVKKDVANAAIIADSLEHVDFVMSMALASDVPEATAFVHEFEAMVLNTTKPILYCANDIHDLRQIYQIAVNVAGCNESLSSKPFLMLYAEPSSPLQHTAETIRKILFCAEKKLPVICGPAVMMGATGPVTAAGALVIANCEILSGLVIHQLKCKGAPFIYGGGVPPMDMRTSVCSYGAPEEHLNSAALASLGNYYNLPVFTTAGCSDSHVFDQQAGMEVGFNLLAHGLAGANLIHDLGYMGSGATASMEMLLLCNEAVGMVKHFIKGIEITPQTIALDVIEKVGPGGNFFADEHTYKYFKKHMYFPKLLNRNAFEKWKEAGATTFDQRANQQILAILDNHRVPELSKYTRERIREITYLRDGLG